MNCKSEHSIRESSEKEVNTMFFASFFFLSCSFASMPMFYLYNQKNITRICFFVKFFKRIFHILWNYYHYCVLPCSVCINIFM